MFFLFYIYLSTIIDYLPTLATHSAVAEHQYGAQEYYIRAAMDPLCNKDAAFIPRNILS